MLVPTLKQQTVENNVQRLLTSASYQTTVTALAKRDLRSISFADQRLAISLRAFSHSAFNVIQSGRRFLQ